jgi:hypothetical protein
MSDDNKGYTVRDRRRFDAEGEPRADAEPGRSEPAKKDPGPPQPRPADAGAKGQAPAAPPPKTEPRPPRQPQLSREQVDFSSLVLSIATNAMISLQGQTPDGRIVGRPNLPAAAQHIDILTMLEDKTHGNLTPEEDELLKSVLYDLRMHYVEIARQLEGRPPQKQ